MDEIVTVIPALNEGNNILFVVDKLKECGLSQVIVSVDATSSDNTYTVLSQAKIPCIKGERSGYDPTVQAGVFLLDKLYPSCKYVLFSDAGGKYPYEVIKDFILEMDRGADLVMGSRVLEREHMLWHQKLGTQLILFPIKILFGENIKDISPFRLIRYAVLKRLNMQPQKFRWPSEMLVKCLAARMKVVEVPVTSLKRQGVSKVSANFKNSVLAGLDMLSALQFVFFKLSNE